MRRRISPARVRVPRRFLPWLLTANLLAGLLLGGWYLAQPEPRQREVGRLVANAFERDKQVSFLEVAWDVWQLYYAGGAGAGKIAAGDKTLIYGGAPRALTESAANRVLVNRGYAVGYSDARANPLWAAYRMQDLARIPEAPKRPERFETDRRTAARVGPEAYSGSGYDRGHLAPNYGIATRYGAAAQKETFLMSNIAPQRHALNAGLWQDLERRNLDAMDATGAPEFAKDEFDRAVVCPAVRAIRVLQAVCEGSSGGRGCPYPDEPATPGPDPLTRAEKRKACTAELTADPRDLGYDWVETAMPAPG